MSYDNNKDVPSKEYIDTFSRRIVRAIIQYNLESDEGLSEARDFKELIDRVVYNDITRCLILALEKNIQKEALDKNMCPKCFALLNYKDSNNVYYKFCNACGWEEY